MVKRATRALNTATLDTQEWVILWDAVRNPDRVLTNPMDLYVVSQRLTEIERRG
jgi:hypothetical protein